MYRLTTKRTTNKTSRRKREREFFYTTTRVLVYCALFTVDNSS